MPLPNIVNNDDLFKDVDFAAARKRMVEEGRIIDIKTAFGTLSILKHPLFSED